MNAIEHTPKETVQYTLFFKENSETTYKLRQALTGWNRRLSLFPYQCIGLRKIV